MPRTGRFEYVLVSLPMHSLTSQIWDISKKRIRHLLQGHAQEIYSLDFSRDGRYLVSGSGDKSARVWDIETGSCVFDLRVEDYIIQDGSPIDAGITSVARKFPEMVDHR